MPKIVPPILNNTPLAFISFKLLFLAPTPYNIPPIAAIPVPIEKLIHPALSF